MNKVVFLFRSVLPLACGHGFENDKGINTVHAASCRKHRKMQKQG